MFSARWLTQQKTKQNSKQRAVAAQWEVPSSDALFNIAHSILLAFLVPF